jgi:glucose/arabinose dehydrogenase
VISPAGLMIYAGDRFPAWKGNVFIGGLSSKALVRIELKGEEAREVERYAMGTRIRDVEEGPNGSLWVLEDGAKARLLELQPK